MNIDTSRSGYINLDKLHAYLLRLPGIYSSRDAESILDRISKDKSSITGFTFHKFKKLFITIANDKSNTK